MVTAGLSALATVSCGQIREGSGDTETPGVTRTASSLDGETVVYNAVGGGDAALVLIHGGFCNSTYWDTLIPDLANRYRVIALDLVGHGKSSSARRHWTMEAFAEDVAAVVQQEDAHNVVLIGHSLGANVAPLAAERLGNRVVAVIGIDGITAVQYGVTDDVVDAGMHPFEVDFAQAMEQMVRATLFIPGDDSSIVKRVVSDMAGADPAMGVATLRALYTVNMGPPLAAMHQAGVAFTLLNNATQPTDVDGLRAHYPDLRFVTFVETGHFPMLTDPETFGPLLQSEIEHALSSFPANRHESIPHPANTGPT